MYTTYTHYFKVTAQVMILWHKYDNSSCSIGLLVRLGYTKGRIKKEKNQIQRCGYPYYSSHHNPNRDPSDSLNELCLFTFLTCRNFNSQALRLSLPNNLPAVNFPLVTRTPTQKHIQRIRLPKLAARPSNTVMMLGRRFSSIFLLKWWSLFYRATFLHLRGTWGRVQHLPGFRPPRRGPPCSPNLLCFSGFAHPTVVNGGERAE